LPYTHIIPQGCEAKSYERGWNDAIDSIVEGEPTIEPERKKGKWIDSRTDIVCSICSSVFDGEIVYMCKGGRLKYCPNCGTEMRYEE
jgi:hypothetical protein